MGVEWGRYERERELRMQRRGKMISFAWMRIDRCGVTADTAGRGDACSLVTVLVGCS